MDEILRVQGVERGQHVERNVDGVAYGDCPLRHALGQRLPLEQLHGEIQRAVDLADVEDLADVGMVDRGRASRLAPEPPAGNVVEPVRADRFDRDPALQALVERLVDDTHAAPTQVAKDSKMGESVREGHVRGRWATGYGLRGAGTLDAGSGHSLKTLRGVGEPGRRMKTAIPSAGEPFSARPQPGWVNATELSCDVMASK